MRTIAWLILFEFVILTTMSWQNPVFNKFEGGIGKNFSTPTVVPLGIPMPLSTADIMRQFSQQADKWAQQPPSRVTVLNKVEQRVLDLTNAERRKKGLRPLKLDKSLRKVARTHSIDMLKRNFFDHTNPEELTPQDRITIVHRSMIGTTGENIWMMDGWDIFHINDLAKKSMEGWMNSPGHKANILRKKFTHLGVGGVSKYGKVYLTQNFSSTQAFLKQPLDLELKKGERLLLATKPVSRRATPVKYAFWLANKNVLAAAPVSLRKKRINLSPGEYQIRFYFPEIGRYLIYTGPQIIVTP